MIIVISGSRHWNRANYDQIEERILELRDECRNAGDTLEVAHGKSRGGGVDKYVAEVCFEHHITEWPFPVAPDLDGRHKGAPLNRNKRMIRTMMPDRFLAFRSPGKSNGTDQARAFAESLGITTEVIHERVVG